MTRSTLLPTYAGLAGCLLLLAACSTGQIELGGKEDGGDTAADGEDTAGDTGGDDTAGQDTGDDPGDTGGDSGDPVEEPAAYAGHLSIVATYSGGGGGGHNDPDPNSGESVACTGEFDALVQPDGIVAGFATCTAYDMTFEGPVTGTVAADGRFAGRWDYEVWNYPLSADLMGMVDANVFAATVTDEERGLSLTGDMTGERQ